MQEIPEGMSVASKRRTLTAKPRLELIQMPGQFCVRQSGPLVVDAMQRFVEKRERDQTSDPVVGDDTPRCSIRSSSSHTDVLDIFSPTLKIAGDKGRHKIHPYQILPEVEHGSRGYDQYPREHASAHLDPNPAADPPVFDGRMRL